MILFPDEKEKVIDYLKISRRASHGKPEGLESLSTDEKMEMARIFRRLRDQGILAYISRNDELVLKKIKPYRLDYDWDLKDFPEMPEFDESKCPKRCKGCFQVDYCSIRRREWKRRIDAIGVGVKRRTHPEGVLMAEEIIKYMRNEFMGGI